MEHIKQARAGVFNISKIWFKRRITALIAARKFVLTGYGNSLLMKCSMVAFFFHVSRGVPG